MNRGAWQHLSRWDRMLTGALLLAIVGALGALAYVIATPKVGERFTEFYLLGPGSAEDYPRQISLGEKVRVRIGVVNIEGEPVIYRIAIAIDGEKVEELGPISLGPQKKWEEEAGFRPTKAGRNQKVEFLLYKGESDQHYRSLHLWVNV